MGILTDIQWATSTVNPTTGCDGCELWKLIPDLGRFGGPCYAGNYHETRMAKALPGLYAADFTEVRLAPGRMAKAAAWPDLCGKPKHHPWIPPEMPRMIFIGDMGDLFSKEVPFEYVLDEVIANVTSPKGERHIWMTLTKQPSRMAAFDAWLESRSLVWPDNLWAGTSITSQRSVRRFEQLRRVRATVRFLSLEPMLEFVDLAGVLDGSIGWVLIGGESDQKDYKARPFDIGWARRTLAVCELHDVPAFVKQLGAHVVARNDEVADWFDRCGHLRLSPTEKFQGASGRVQGFRDSHGGDWSEWPEDLRVRELPEVAVA